MGHKEPFQHEMAGHSPARNMKIERKSCLVWIDEEDIDSVPSPYCDWSTRAQPSGSDRKPLGQKERSFTEILDAPTASSKRMEQPGQSNQSIHWRRQDPFVGENQGRNPGNRGRNFKERKLKWRWIFFSTVHYKI